ncbi:acetylgalactosaminyl-O-glycosyl-glycoprotein beta-1,3-N-acetylglucosaminyltransferase-like [Anopheles aquasalis]|uniref:acetylgalactosaminyl-O-glycosyl-glycoprotein beta-1,3-N-acetylglucosaminyltransferase-like n=1 Tax=Anopheles aquasalis TaxID=42839 RepID=UPI00215A8240|nr:acetylgalactosaminyl-O-glycosyl-glycoprotein beta-1,3-N-acetylglucosaminyltransferase-like [Anopheles aquasalis]
MHSSNLVHLEWNERLDSVVNIDQTSLPQRHHLHQLHPEAGHSDVYRRLQDNDGGSSSSTSNDTECTTLLDESCRKHERLYDFVSASEIRHRGHSGCSKSKVFFFVTALFVFFTILVANLPFSNDHGRVGTIAGWGLNTSRLTVNYVLPHENTTVIEPLSVCMAEEPRTGLSEESEKVFLLIVVCSSAANFEARQTIRQTWGNVRDFNYGQFRVLQERLRGEYLDPKPSVRQTLKEYIVMPSGSDDSPVTEEPTTDSSKRNASQQHTTSGSPLLANSNFNIKVLFLVGQSEADYAHQRQRNGQPMVGMGPSTAEAATRSDSTPVNGVKPVSQPLGSEQPSSLTRGNDRFGTMRSLFPHAEDMVDPAFNALPPVIDELQLRILNESETYGDIIQESFIDSYNNLTLKTIMMLKWVTNNCDGKVKFLMKCDDDTFVNVPNLVHVLLGGTVPLYKAAISFYDTNSVAVKSSKNRLVTEGNHLLTGFLFCEAKPIGDTSSKWYSPAYMYGKDVYPKYLSGTAYLMNFEVAKLLYRGSLSTPIFHLEDVYLTGIVADRVKVRRRHHPLFFYSYTKDLCALRGMISQHQLQPSEIRAAYDYITNASIVCPVPDKRLTVGQLKLQQRKKCQ